MNWTDNYVGIPFKVKGRDRDGVDCWGLICLIYKDVFGIELPSFADEYKNLDDLKLIEGLYSKHSQNGEGWVRILRGQELTGDVFLMPLTGLRTHVTVCVEKGLMIHITDNINVSIEEYQTSLWLKRYERTLIYRHPKVYKI